MYHCLIKRMYCCTVLIFLIFKIQNTVVLETSAWKHTSHISLVNSPAWPPSVTVEGVNNIYFPSRTAFSKRLL